MRIEHRGKRPRNRASAYLAPPSTVCGDMTIGEDGRILFGAVIVGEEGTDYAPALGRQTGNTILDDG